MTVSLEYSLKFGNFLNYDKRFFFYKKIILVTGELPKKFWTYWKLNNFRLKNNNFWGLYISAITLHLEVIVLFLICPSFVNKIIIIRAKVVLYHCLGESTFSNRLAIFFPIICITDKKNIFCSNDLTITLFPLARNFYRWWDFFIFHEKSSKVLIRITSSKMYQTICTNALPVRNSLV